MTKAGGTYGSSAGWWRLMLYDVFWKRYFLKPWKPGSGIELGSTWLDFFELSTAALLHQYCGTIWFSGDEWKEQLHNKCSTVEVKVCQLSHLVVFSGSKNREFGKVPGLTGRATETGRLFQPFSKAQRSQRQLEPWQWRLEGLGSSWRVPSKTREVFASEPRELLGERGIFAISRSLEGILFTNCIGRDQKVRWDHAFLFLDQGHSKTMDSFLDLHLMRWKTFWLWNKQDTSTFLKWRFDAALCLELSRFNHSCSAIPKKHPVFRFSARHRRCLRSKLGAELGPRCWSGETGGRRAGPKGRGVVHALRGAAAPPRGAKTTTPWELWLLVLVAKRVTVRCEEIWRNSKQ